MKDYTATKEMKYCYVVAWKHAKWKKSDTKGHTSYDSVYIKHPKQTDPWRQKADQWLSGEGNEELVFSVLELNSDDSYKP